MQIDFVSIFPELIENWFTQGVISRALSKNILQFNYHTPRIYSNDRHGRVDDRPFGGGPGMVMQYDPLTKAAHAIEENIEGDSFHIYLSPQGEPFNSSLAKSLAMKSNLILWCGRYEGIDQRFIQETVNLEISVGDFVISGGEMAAALVADAVCRFVPEVLGDSQSAVEDSFHNSLLDHPHYTRPENTDRISAPDILLSGDHARIAKWRLKQALGKTFLQRPDIIQDLELSAEQKALLNEYLTEFNFSGEPL